MISVANQGHNVTDTANRSQIRRSGDRIRTILCTVKNEGPFFLEWLAYHRLIGFNRFVIFSNDCTDGTHEILQALDAAGLIHHFDNSEVPPDLPPDPQMRAYTRANAMDLVRESDWIMVIDGDEFLEIKPGEGTLASLFAALPDRTDAIGVQWRIFGSGGIVDFDDALQIDAFRLAAPRDFACSPNHLAIKTLFRPDLVQRFGIHRPVYKGTSGNERNPVLFVNSAGTDVTSDFLRGRWSMPPQHVSYELAQVNHYMIRSHEVFLMKRWRGTANSANAERINLDYFDKYNSNFERDDGMARWVRPVQAEIARLESQVPGLSQMVRSSREGYANQIAQLKERLQAEAPDEYRRLFDPQVVRAEIAAQQDRLAALRKKIGQTGQLRMMPPQRKAPAPPEPRMAERGSNPDDEALTDGLEEQPQMVQAAPSWLVDLRAGPSRRGFFQSFDQTGVHFVDRGSGHLVLSFDNLSAANLDQVDRESWGYGFIRKNGWSHLGVFAYAPNWFREREMLDHLQRLAKDGFFRNFDKVTMIGTSMGAYAATALAPLAPGCTVVAFSPQSTLKKKLVPWEKRFAAGRKADWSGPFHDGAEGAKSAGKVWLVYDPAMTADLRHAHRYEGENIHHLRARYADHKTALFLRRAELLSTVVREAVEDTLTEARFYRLYRQGRQIPWYLNGVGARIAGSRRPDRLQRFEAYLNAANKPQIARALHLRFPEIMSATT